MIQVEYVNGQYQDGKTSVAIKAERRLGHNPQLVIQRIGTSVLWELNGLNQGSVDSVSGRPRKPRLDFYIGLNDIINQRAMFPNSTGTVLAGIGVANSQGTERPGGKTVKMVDVVGRTHITDVQIDIPPFRLSKKANAVLFFNVDLETAWYGIKDSGGKITKAEIHFGVQHEYIVTQGTQPRAVLTMNENQYATLLSFIDQAIHLFNTKYRHYL